MIDARDGVVIYTLPGCTHCNATKRMLKKKGIEYIEKVLTPGSQQAKQVAEQYGATSAPIVVTKYEYWSGYRPDKIEELEK